MGKKFEEMDLEELRKTYGALSSVAIVTTTIMGILLVIFLCYFFFLSPSDFPLPMAVIFTSILVTNSVITFSRRAMAKAALEKREASVGK